MNTTFQPAMHPDAEILNAFAEQLLTAAERDQVLVHMTTCSRCREVVFLAQQAIAKEQPEPAPVVVGAVKPVRRSWFAGWRWTWVPVAALAGFVGFAVVQHYRHPPKQMAGNVSHVPVQLNPEPPQAPAAVEKSERRLEKRQASPRAPAAARDAAKPQMPKDTGKNLDELKQIAQSKEALGAIGTLAPAGPGATGGSIHGAMTARASGQSIGGPMAANQVQQQNANQFQQQNVAPEQNALQAARNGQLDYANRPMAKAAPAAASETVTVQAEPKPAAAPPPPVRERSIAPAATQTVEAASDKLTNAKKTKALRLPSGVNALSSASAGGRTIAIDPAGALFLSVDSGKHWQSIPTQWTGRAVLVKVREIPLSSLVLSGARPPHFELVNDKLQSWVSEDGKTWTADTGQ